MYADLNEEMNAVIGDFGLAKEMKENELV